MKELAKTKLIFWGVILTGFILSLFLFAAIGNWVWLIWGILVLIFIFGSLLPFKIWFAVKIAKQRKEIKKEIGDIIEKIHKQTEEKYPPSGPNDWDYLKKQREYGEILRKKYLDEIAKKYNFSEEEVRWIEHDYNVKATEEFKTSIKN